MPSFLKTPILIGKGDKSKTIMLEVQLNFTLTQFMEFFFHIYIYILDNIDNTHLQQ